MCQQGAVGNDGQKDCAGAEIKMYEERSGGGGKSEKGTAATDRSEKEDGCECGDSCVQFA